MTSRTVHDSWAVQSGRMLVAVPYAHVSENSVIQRMFVGPRARRRAERWVQSSTTPPMRRAEKTVFELR